MKIALASRRASWATTCMRTTHKQRAVRCSACDVYGERACSQLTTLMQLPRDAQATVNVANELTNEESFYSGSAKSSNDV